MKHLIFVFYIVASWREMLSVMCSTDWLIVIFEISIALNNFWFYNMFHAWFPSRTELTKLEVNYYGQRTIIKHIHLMLFANQHFTGIFWTTLQRHFGDTATTLQQHFISISSLNVMEYYKIWWTIVRYNIFHQSINISLITMLLQ